MMPDEKAQLLALLEHETRWAQNAEARSEDGAPVQYDDDTAVAWDLTGALCHLFGWHRACVLFGQIDRHIHGRRFVFGWPERPAELDSMVALQAFNDHGDTTFESLRQQIASMPAWQGVIRRRDAVGGGRAPMDNGAS